MSQYAEYGVIFNWGLLRLVRATQVALSALPLCLSILGACTTIICRPLCRIALYGWRSLPELRALSSSSSYCHRVGIYYSETPCQYSSLLAAEFTSSICHASNERVDVDGLACHACRLHTLLALLPSPRCALQCAQWRQPPMLEIGVS